MIKNTIPVPKIIYKNVEYRLKNCLLEETSCWYSAVIVINNEPDLLKSKDEKLCPKDVTTDWGWEEITKDFEGNQFEKIYVCENDTSVQKKLSIGLGSREKVAGGLNLSNFVYSKDGGKTFVKMDIKTQVDRRFKAFSNKEEDPDIESGMMMERVQFQNDFFDDSKIRDEVSEERKEAGK